VRNRSVFVLLALALLVAGSCRSQSGGEEAGGETTASSTAASTDVDGFGDLASPCGEGDASGATAQGVTDTAIRVGTMSDATATAQPGLNQELWDSAEAFVAWCNEQGGIEGRKLVDTRYESKLFEARQATIEACEQEFMLVGGGAAFDDESSEERLNCGLPDVPAFNATLAGTEADLSHRALPTPFDQLSVGEAVYLAEQQPDAVNKAGILTANFPSAKNIALRARTGYTEAGWNFIDEQLYNPAGEANWTGIVASLRNAGVEALLYSGTYEPLAAFLQAADEQDWKPEILIGTSSIYKPDLVTEAGSAAEGVYTYSNVPPFEDPPEGSATSTYLNLLDQYVDGAEPSLMGAQAVSAWLMWATAAKACGSELTRECIAEEIDELDEWTAGGLQAPSDPAAGTPPPCFVLMQVQDGTWTKVHPEEGMDCDESYLKPTDADYQ
jgi:ABC-type branched-subunit amino acid transport system substrate-binding protein